MCAIRRMRNTDKLYLFIHRVAIGVALVAALGAALGVPIGLALGVPIGVVLGQDRLWKWS